MGGERVEKHPLSSSVLPPSHPGSQSNPKAEEEKNLRAFPQQRTDGLILASIGSKPNQNKSQIKRWLSITRYTHMAQGTTGPREARYKC